MLETILFFYQNSTIFSKIPLLYKRFQLYYVRKEKRRSWSRTIKTKAEVQKMKKFLFLIFSILCIFTVTSCKDDTEKKPPVVETEKVEVIFNTLGGNSIASVEIDKGGKVSKPTDPTRKGYTFEGWYTTEACTTGTEFDFTKEVNEKVTLYAKWKEAPKQEEVVSIEIKVQPTKLTYIEGEKFDKTGMVIEGTLSNGTKKEITDYLVMPNGDLPLGLEMFSVTYGDLEVFGSLTVVAKEIVTVEIESMPTKTVYKNYEVFDPTGLVLKVSYNNGKYDLVDSNIKYNREILYNAKDSTTVSYLGIEVRVPISVTKVAHYGVPNQKPTTYIDAKAVVDQLSSLEQIDGNRILGTSTFGDIQIVASAGRVMQHEGIDDPNKQFHAFDHQFNGMIKFGGATSPEGRYLIITPTENGILNLFASRPSSAQSSLLIYDRYDETTLPEDAKQVIELDIDQEYSIPVYVGETYYITSTANAFLKGIALVYNPTYYEVDSFELDTALVCKDFAVGQAFTADGLAATVTFNNQSAELKASQYEVIAPDMSTAGTKTVTVKYQDMLEKTYEITVHELTGIEVTTLPTKNVYFAGENLEVEGLVVMAVAGDIKYAIEGYTISKLENLAVDDEITISWKDFETVLPITIKANPITGIRVKNLPAKTSYKSGEAFDPTGLVLEIVYDGQDPKEITDLTEVTFNKTVLQATDTVVQANWDIFFCDIEIEVQQVDWYVKDDTVYINATDILKALGIEVNDSTPANGNIAAGSKGDFDVIHIEAINKALQYERIKETYEYGGYTYTGVFKTGGVTGGAAGADRYISVTPNKNGVFTFYCTSKAATTIFLLNSLTMPDASDSTTYVAKHELAGDGAYVEVNFTVEANQTYYFWFTQQTFIRGMNLSYGRVNSIVEELVLDTNEVKKSFQANEEFTYDGLKVSVKCADGNTYTLEANEFTVTAPDMSSAGTKVVEVKFKEVTIQTYEVVVE